MVNRIYLTIHLTALLISRSRFEPGGPVQRESDYNVASNLAAGIRELTIVNDGERMRCSTLPHGIRRNFIELFGPVAGDITIAARIEPLQLVVFKRRALGLVVVELLSKGATAAANLFQFPKGAHRSAMISPT